MGKHSAENVKPIIESPTQLIPVRLIKKLKETQDREAKRKKK